MSRFCCIWIPDFPAWAAVRSDPGLRHRAVLIYVRGRIVAASPAARQAGVQTGWTLARAQSLLPDALALPQHGATVAAAWEEVLSALYDLTPQIESQRPGLALADIEPPAAVQPLLHEWQAYGGVAQGGCADDRTTAEIAALSTQAGKLRTVRPGCSSVFLRRVPIILLSEVGVRADTIERLGWFGWHHIGQLRSLTRRQLVAQFDQGETLWRYAQASDTRPVAAYVLPSIITTRYAFEQPVREPCEIEPVLDHLMNQAHSQLNGRVAAAVSVGVETTAGWTRGGRLLREPTAVWQTLRRAAQHALEAALRPGMAVSALEVRLGSLAQPRAVQGHLFDFSRPVPTQAVQAVERRFPGWLCHIVTTDPNSYLPEAGWRFEPIQLPPTGKASRPEAHQPQADRTHADRSHADRSRRRRTPPQQGMMWP